MLARINTKKYVIWSSQREPQLEFSVIAVLNCSC